MSGFNLSELLPFYLDETDEQIHALNDALLRLESAPDNEKTLQEAFRIFHTIKGSSAVMGFEAVKNLTHQLESLFDQLRSGKRAVDRPMLNLFFRALDELRDYHRDLRARGSSDVDLSGLTGLVLDFLRTEPGKAGTPAGKPAVAAVPPSPEPKPASVEVPEIPATPPRPPVEATVPVSELVASEDLPPGPGSGELRLTVVFEPDLQWADMKARLILTRLSSRARVLSTDPSQERLDAVDALKRFTATLRTEATIQELQALADIDGVASIRVEVPTVAVESVIEVQDDAVPEPIVSGPENDVEIEAPVVEAELVSSPEPVAPAAAFAGVENGHAETVVGPATAPSPGVPAASPLGDGPRPAKVAETVRVEIDRLDHLMNLAGELVINKARFIQVASGFEELFRNSRARALAADTHDRLDGVARMLETLGEADRLGPAALDRWRAQVRRLRENFQSIRHELDVIRQGRERLNALGEAIHQLTRVSDGIQKGVMDTRMVPIGPLFARFRRVVRDLSHASGKAIDLKISGESTELDKRMIDELGDPLIHLIRNAVDHGLEPPEERKAAGKAAGGSVTLAAMHRGNSVVVTVGDDGRGIDPERVRRKIVSRGWLIEEEARRLSDREVIQYIWRPGFSTAEKVTDISGRGVGMDIVKSRIEALNGSVDVRSVVGQGTSFVIRLPLTLAIMPSLLVKILDEVYALPLDHIDEIVEVRPERVHQLHGARAIEIRSRVIALVDLRNLFRWGGGPHPAVNNRHADPGPIQVVVLENGESPVGLMVDQLIGMQDVVLKSLARNYRPVEGLSGASILGDGRVSLILDVDNLIRLAGLADIRPTVATAGA